MSEQVTIYALVDPRDDSVRYIGQTCVALDARLSQHLRDSPHNAQAKAFWLQELQSSQLLPRIEPLVVTDREHADATERRCISDHLERGCSLTNTRHHPTRRPRQPRRRPSSHAPRRTESLVIRVTEEMYDRIDRVAERRGLAVGSLVRDVLERWLTRAEREQDHD